LWSLLSRAPLWRPHHGTFRAIALGQDPTRSWKPQLFDREYIRAIVWYEVLILIRKFEYKGHVIGLTVLAEQGRWGYRIDDGPVHTLDQLRAPMLEPGLFLEAELAARREVDRLHERQLRTEAAMERPEVRRRA
jgi:hypothetical protein